MSDVGFFTAVTYGDHPRTYTQLLLETVDNYFYLGGKKACCIQGKTKQGLEKTLLSETNSSVVARIAKFVSYFVFFPAALALLFTKIVLRTVYRFRLIDPKQKLEKGINISDDAITKIKMFLPKITHEKKCDGIEWLSKGKNLVFKLKDDPSLVFKIAHPEYIEAHESMDGRFENMVKGKEICIIEQLGLLNIPHAKKFTVNLLGIDYTLIAEESLPFNPNESAQEHLYQVYSKELSETARQLAVFIARTAFNDVTWRNIPILDESPDVKGPRHVGLIDLEHMENVIAGFTGDALYGSRGLIRCIFSKELIEAVLAEAQKQGVDLVDWEEVVKSRLAEIESDEKLQEYYKQHEIKTGKEPLQVNLNTLELNLEKEGLYNVFNDVKMTFEEQPVTMKKVVEEAIVEINKHIESSPELASVKGKRQITLTHNHPVIKNYNILKCAKDDLIAMNPDSSKQTWLEHIFQALVDKGYLFKFSRFTNGEYFIQA